MAAINTYGPMGHVDPAGEPGMAGAMGHMDHTKTDEMSSKDILERLAGHDMKDEMEVSNKYLDYAIAFEKEGHEWLAEKFMEMAYEEFTHAKFQKHVLIDKGYTICDENTTMYHALKQRLMTLFRES